jgi:hypothetical protein
MENKGLVIVIVMVMVIATVIAIVIAKVQGSKLLAAVQQLPFEVLELLVCDLWCTSSFLGSQLGSQHDLSRSINHNPRSCTKPQS